MTASGKYGIAGSGEGLSVDIYGGKLKLYGKESATNNLSGCKLDETMVKTPKDAEYDSKLRGFAVNGKLVSDTLFLYLARYKVFIGEYQLNENCCKDLSVIPYVKGKASYDPATGTLTLENAKLSSGLIIKENSTILVKGKCEINVVNSYEDYYGIRFESLDTAVIRGVDGGELKIKLTRSDNVYYYSEGISIRPYHGDNVNVYIEDCDMEINCDLPVYSYISNSPDWERVGGNLNIVNSNVKLIPEYYPVLYLRDIKLSECKITSPQNAIYDAWNCFYLEGDNTYYKGILVIERDNAVGIENIKSDVAAAKSDVYTIEGVKLNSAVENLPSGIYIINGKKVLKK